MAIFSRCVKRGWLLTLPIILFMASIIMAQNTPLYREPYRPQYHYSPPCGWMNDPNGMVYYEGEYHLFYQFYPNDIVQGPKHWGHAVSTDLIHWETLPIALYPDDIGAIWSGSVVVDAQNTSGLVPGGGLIALYSYENQSQGAAYSTDRGRTWTKYAGNPIIPAMARDFRDPKVFWYAATQQWVMIIAAGKDVQIFTSPDLLHWEFRSSFVAGHTLGVWEVPDLFPLEINGQTKWVMLVSVGALAPAGGSGIQYFIGQFDGQTFTNDNPSGTVLWLDYGPDNYAGTTWSDMPDNRRLYIGWMSNWQYASNTPTDRWRGAATLPQEFKLVQTPDGIRLAQTPVDLATLRQPLGTWDNQALSGDLPLEGVHGRLLEIIAEFQAGSAQRFGLDVHRGADSRTRIVYNAKQKQLLISRGENGIGGFTPAFGAPLPLPDGRVRLHLFVDESSVELFAQDGLTVLSAQTFENPANDGVALFAEGGDATLTHLEIYALSSVWPEGQQPSDFDFCNS